VNNKLQKIWKWSWPNLMYYPGICLQELRIMIKKNYRHKSGILDRRLIRVFSICSDQRIGHVRQRKPHFGRNTTYSSELSFATPLGNGRRDFSSSHLLCFSSAYAVAELLTLESRTIRSSCRPLKFSRKHLNQ
jgi:hypothetical protein